MSAAEPTAAAGPIRFDADGLVPVVTQDATTGAVLMLAFMNAQALSVTRATGRAHYWSRSRGKLWRKGESSGNEQIVEAIYVNCERNSVLLRVRQQGAVCHDGYPTCFYRRLDEDDALTTVAERAFDPAAVYGREGSTNSPESDQATAKRIATSRILVGAYVYLRDHDLTAISGTSARLRALGPGFPDRIADELDELAGVLDGTHAHADPRADLLLEASQVVYWVVLTALKSDPTWSAASLSAALVPETPTPSAGLSDRLRAESRSWRTASADFADFPARLQSTTALVAAACAARNTDPADALERDLRELRVRPYLAPYFATDATADEHGS